MNLEQARIMAKEHSLNVSKSKKSVILSWNGNVSVNTFVWDHNTIIEKWQAGKKVVEYSN